MRGKKGTGLAGKCPIDWDPGKVIAEFFFSDHYLIGQRYAKTASQLQKAMGDKIPDEQTFEGYWRRSRMHNAISAARRRLQKAEPPRFLYAKKIAKKPTIYYLVNPDSEEFLNLFERSHRHFLKLGKRIRHWQVLIGQVLPRIKNEKLKELCEKVYEKRIGS